MSIFVASPKCRETPRSPPLSLKGELERSTKDVGGDVGGGGEGRKSLDQLTKRIFLRDDEQRADALDTRCVCGAESPPPSLC